MRGVDKKIGKKVKEEMMGKGHFNNCKVNKNRGGTMRGSDMLLIIANLVFNKCNL